MRQRVRIFPLLEQSKQEFINDNVSAMTRKNERAVKIGLYAGGCTLCFGVALGFASETPPLDHFATDVFNPNVVSHSADIAGAGLAELIVDGVAFGCLRARQATLRERQARQQTSPNPSSIEFL